MSSTRSHAGGGHGGPTGDRGGRATRPPDHGSDRGPASRGVRSVAAVRRRRRVPDPAGLPTWERTLAHELGHLVLEHGGIPIVEAARDTAELASDDLIRTCSISAPAAWGQAAGAEQEAEDFAALLIYRLGRMPSDRSSIVQVRLGEAFG